MCFGQNCAVTETKYFLHLQVLASQVIFSNESNLFVNKLEV